MLNRMWKTPPCRNMYVTGCQNDSRSTTSAGCRPNHMLMLGMTNASRNAATLTAISALTAGVSGPGPKEYENDEVAGGRRIKWSVFLDQSVPTRAYRATSVPVVSTLPTLAARGGVCTSFPDGKGAAHAAAAIGVNAIMTSVRSIPMRSASSPTNGTIMPPTPQAKPIISEETVAALMGAIIWPKVTLTGRVD